MIISKNKPLNNGDIDPQKKIIIISGNEIGDPQPSIIKRTDFNDGNKVTQNDSVVTSLNDELTSVNSMKEDLTNTKKEVLVSHISLLFEDLRKDIATVFQTTKLTLKLT